MLNIIFIIFMFFLYPKNGTLFCLKQIYTGRHVQTEPIAKGMSNNEQIHVDNIPRDGSPS
jgi:hypothetical protein